MKKQGNCEQCHKRKELSNIITSTFHRHFKYKNLNVRLHCHIQNGYGIAHVDMFLCKSCILDVMRAMKAGDNYE